MGITISEESGLDEVCIQKAISSQEPLEILTDGFPRKTEDFAGKVLSSFLNHCKHSELFGKMNYCVCELIGNAVRANIKRIYFKQNNLDINNTEDYKSGMPGFKKEFSVNMDAYEQFLKEYKLFVKLILQFKDEVLKIEVHNNSVLTEIEAARIENKISTCHKYSLEEISGNFLDETEGAGMGLNSLLILLTNLGMPKENLKFLCQDGFTICKIEYPIPEIEEI